MEIDKMREYIVRLVAGELQLQRRLWLYPRTKRVMELSFYEARNLGHNYVGTEHLLLALIREGEGVAARIMKDAGVDLEKVRALVMKIPPEEGTETHQGVPQWQERYPQPGPIRN